jgi:ribosomal protein L11 methylase PrmA
VDERLNRNKKIALSTLTEVDIRFKWFTSIISGIEFQDMMEDSASTSGNSVTNELNQDEYRLKEIQKILRDGDIVLDLGSNIGLTAILIAKMNPGVKVIGVEPSPVNWVAAQRNIKKMGVTDSVTVLPAALCNSRVRTVKLFQPWECRSVHNALRRSDETRNQKHKILARYILAR